LARAGTPEAAGISLRIASQLAGDIEAREQVIAQAVAVLAAS
jgi:hypothetical protein